MIAIDTLNVDHLGCYGCDVPKEPTTPFVDSLARRGVLFGRHYATDVPTPSSFTSLFCGTRGIRHGIIGFNNKASEFNCNTPLLAECFARDGFRTGMISNLLYPCPWLRTGFEDVYAPGSRFQGGTAQEVTNEAAKMIEHYGEDRFFLFVHYWDPHVPYLARSLQNYREMFPAEEYKEAAPDMEYFERNMLIRRFYDRKHQNDRDPLQPAENLALYDANVRYVDDQIRRLFQDLQKIGIDESTLVVITSDHGEAFGEYGFWDHYSSYRNISQLPWIFTGPDIDSLQVSVYTQNIDIMPTLLEFANIKIPKRLDGKSMISLLQGEQKKFRKEVVVNSDATVIQRMLVKDQYALMYTPARPVWNYIEEYELFNLSEDPDQLNDISARENEMTCEMRISLGDWTTRMLSGSLDPLWVSVVNGGWM